MVSNFLLDAYLGWLDGGDPDREADFLDWLAASVGFMTRRWWSGAKG